MGKAKALGRTYNVTQAVEPMLEASESKHLVGNLMLGQMIPRTPENSPGTLSECRKSSERPRTQTKKGRAAWGSSCKKIGLEEHREARVSGTHFLIPALRR